ncbi:helix-turn-helix domain-containing protein [Streptomyces sp. CRN 30]|uniref:helix-turn-helix domain-containing protein n=1 Tax=Streptomyces sp. CRN 30 TaxID=3075613 RepID=UPI002A8177F6|nr:helix-turn-helix domain-containing protein [Streptomyces sp. CRN 30]
MEHSSSIRAHAVSLMRQGVPNRLVAEQFGVPRGTVGWWRSEDRRAHGETYEQRTDCPRCTGREFDQVAYAYLLGLYLGDGHITSKPRQHHLSITCNATQPGLIGAAEEAMHLVMPRSSVKSRPRTGCVEVKSYTRHWVCMFPQHAPGKKHERHIALEPWQQAIVDAHSWEFVRGLIHSDGCRITNWTTRLVGGVRKRYEYPRYLFTNVSDDIRGLCTGTLDRLGVEWTHCTRHGNPYNISVARKASVALMDLRVGPKY